MKAAFFILFVALLAAGIWIAAPSFDARKYLSEENQTMLLERMEKILNFVGEKFPNSILAKQVENELGLCRVMDLPPPTTPNPFANMKPIPTAFFPFSKSVELERVSLLCGFPGHGKSVLLFPVDPSTILIRRRLDKPGALTLEYGNISLVSDQMDFVVDVPTMRLKLKSDKPVSITLHKMPNQYSILIRLGKLDVTYELTAGDETQARPVFVELEAGAILTSEGKELSQKKTMRLLPSGFQEDSSPPPSAAPADASALPPGAATGIPDAPPASAPVAAMPPASAPAPAPPAATVPPLPKR